MTFIQKLKSSIQTTASCLCIGLDPNLKKIPEPVKREHTSPEDQVLYFLKSVIDNTSDLAAAYKPNLAFFEALGSQGLQVFKEI
ncbi:MAG TPA: orotidine-5'-phosphate decarboxylase, partial [Balneolaceae bacterium]|nr:orotidine-5'-phosphate decarboxylase [Balneolaceae bacterium]